MRFSLTLFILLFSACHTLQAQEMVVPLNYNPVQQQYVTQDHKTLYKTTKTTALSLPFFDDFTINHPYPDNTLWDGSWQAYVNNAMGIDPVTRGVATFDALNKEGIPYNTQNNAASVYADSLTSLPIDLSGYTPASNIYLSFYYQPQGNGFAPETQDSLLLYFQTKDTTWLKVWAKEGSPSHPFKAVIIPVSEIQFLHQNFQFRFVNKATININDDVWNIDYVKMDANRFAEDTLTNDVAISAQPTSFLKDYTYMPYQHYMDRPNDERATEVKTTVYNGYNILQNVNYAMTSTEQTTGTALFSGGAGSLVALTQQPQEIVFPTYSNSVPLIENHKYVSFDNRYYIESVSPTEPHDNDTFTQKQIFHNFFAYDDGSAEKSYFLNLFTTLPGKIAIEHHLNVPDTMTGIAIYFGRQVPMGYYKSFSVAVYHSLGTNGNPDSLVYQQDLLDPHYLSQNNFYVYKFDSKVPLTTGTFYVGTIQPALGGSDSLYLGLDVNRTGANHLYYNLSGYWESSAVAGALMIRPIFGPIIPSDVPERPLEKGLLDWSVYPNPANNTIKIYIPNLKPYSYEILDIQGRKMLSASNNISQAIDITNLQAGIYFIRIEQNGLKSQPKKIIKL